MLIIRHGEIFTKSAPVRVQFIKRLVMNIRSALPEAKITMKHWRVYAVSDNEEKDIKTLQRVFGIISVSKAAECGAEMQSITETVADFLPRIKSPFAVRTQRITKTIPLTSQQVNEQIGAFIVKKTGNKVDLDNPKTTLSIEIYGDRAFVFTDSARGPGGLPLGTAGKMKCAYKNANDFLAAWMLMKRGAVVFDSKGKIPLKMKKWAYGAENYRPTEVTGTVSGETSIQKFAENTETLTFTPLIGMSGKELRALENKVFKY